MNDKLKGILEQLTPEQQKALMVPTSEALAELEEVFTRDRMNFVKDSPFYGMLILALDVEGWACGPALGAVNYEKLFLACMSKEDIVKAVEAAGPLSAELKAEIESCAGLLDMHYCDLSQMGRKTLLAHEILHVVFEHLSVPTGLDTNIANIAADAVINRILMRDPLFDLGELPKGCVTPIGSGSVYTGFTVGEGDSQETFHISDFEEKDWIGIYYDIVEQLQKKGMKGGGKKLVSAEDLKALGELLNGKNPLRGDCDGNGEDGHADEASDSKKLNWRVKVAEAYNHAKKQGTEPMGVDRLLAQFGEAKVPWWEKLRRLMRTHFSREDFSWRLNSRRTHLTRNRARHPGCYPKLHSPALGTIWCALDTSGSISQDDIAQGLAEFRALRQTSPFELCFVSCDAEAYSVARYSREEEPDWKRLPIQGGGGTDFRPVFDKVEQYRKEGGEKPALLVYFTDTMGTFPSNPPDYPVVFVCNYSGGKVPWGDLILID